MKKYERIALFQKKNNEITNIVKKDTKQKFSLVLWPNKDKNLVCEKDRTLTLGRRTSSSDLLLFRVLGGVFWSNIPSSMIDLDLEVLESFIVELLSCCFEGRC